MSNLTGCLRKAGDFLNADHRAKILESALGKRGPDRVNAAVAAIDELLQGLDAQLADEGDVRASARRQTETPEFKRWFGDSKVVDKSGKPLIVYHGTEKAGFAAFDPKRQNTSSGTGAPGFFFSNQLGAETYSGTRRDAVIDPEAFADGEREPGNYAVYLSLQNPLVIDMEGRGWNESPPEDSGFGGYEGVAEIAEYAQGADYDGVIVKNVMDEGRHGRGYGWGETTYIAFRPEQIKSAIGNRGTFDPENPDIRMSPARWEVEDSKPLPFGLGDTDTIIRQLQDKQIDLKRVVAAVREQVGDLGDKWDPYLKEELYHERAAKRTKDFLDFELRPLLQSMQAEKVTLDEFETYLHNRHAEERNNQIAKVNPDMPDGGSGINTADARAYLDGLPSSLRSKYDRLAQRIDAIVAKTDEVLVASGLEKQSTIDTWRKTYRTYVPLQREEFESDVQRGTGQGFSVKGGASKRAMGSSQPVANILANLAMQRERTITRAEKNRVATALYGMAIKAPNKEFWKPFAPDRMANDAKIEQELVSLGMAPPDAANVLAEPTQRYLDPNSGLVVFRANPLLRNSDNIVSLRINGEDRYIIFNHRDERANQIARSIKNLDADSLGRVLGVMATFSRYFASINTQWNPIFGVVNLLRDTQGALVNLSTTPIANKKTQVLRDAGSALVGIYADIRAHRKGLTPQSPWAQLWEEFQKEGGPTGYRHLYESPKERSEQIESELRQVTEGKAKQLGRATLNWLSDYNETMENAIRLSAYKAAKEAGLTNERAASLAKNLTVNFNRKGQVATQAGALYAFFNASVQGTARMAETLTGPAGRKIIMGGLLLGVLQAFALKAGGFDEEEPPEFVRDRSLVLPVGDKQYLSFPMPLGLHVLPSAARRVTEWILAGGREPGKRLVGLLGLLADAFNPIGNSGMSLQTISPTAIDWLAALAENQDWSGRPIAKEDMSALDPTPGYTRTRDAASAVSKALSYYLNLFTGGTDYQPGVVSPTPDQIDYFIGQFTGGLGRTIQGVATTVTATATGEDLPPYRIPLLGRFYGNATGQASEAAKFYNNLKRINGHQAEIKGLRRDGKGDQVAAYIRDNPEARLALFTQRLEADLTEAKTLKKKLVQRGASPESVKAVDARITKLMATLNRRVEALRQATEDGGE